MEPTISENEKAIRELYRIAEIQDSQAFVSLFTDDGYFWDVSAGVKYYGQDIKKTVDIYATAFPDMHRELYKFYVDDAKNIVVVELALQGTNKGPLQLPVGTIEPTNNRIDAPCCDVFLLENGKVKFFHCYTAATVMLGQLGVFANLGASLR